MAQDQWREVAMRFCVQNSLIEAIDQRTTSITIESHKLGPGDLYVGTSDTLQLCTMTIPLDNGFAISAVHFENAKLTLAVVLGATEQQVSMIQVLLTEAPEAIGEPLLILGLSSELALDLLTQSVKDSRESCICMARILGQAIKNMGHDSTVNMNFAAEFPMGLRASASENARLSEELKAYKEGLVQALDFYATDEDDEIDKSGRGIVATTPHRRRRTMHEESTTRQKMRDRFGRILWKLDKLIRLSRHSVEELSQMLQEAESISDRVSNSDHCYFLNSCRDHSC